MRSQSLCFLVGRVGRVGKTISGSVTSWVKAHRSAWVPGRAREREILKHHGLLSILRLHSNLGMRQSDDRPEL